MSYCNCMNPMLKTTAEKRGLYRAKNFREYSIPYDIESDDQDEFFYIVDTLIDIVKTKGLTIRQAQSLFQVCNERMLDEEFH